MEGTPVRVRRASGTRTPTPIRVHYDWWWCALQRAPIRRPHDEVFTTSVRALGATVRARTIAAAAAVAPVSVGLSTDSRALAHETINHLHTCVHACMHTQRRQTK